MDWFIELGAIAQAFIATSLTWVATAVGAAIVLTTSRVSHRWLDASLGVAAGVMIAASFWSLLNPSIMMAVETGYGRWRWLPALIGFLAGGALLQAADRLLPHVHLDLIELEGLRTSWRRSTLLLAAITLHHIPEGLAVGVAFGAAASIDPGSAAGATAIASAVALAIGIGLQNVPEGTAVALALRREGMGRRRALFWAQMSGAVDPLAGVAGAGLVMLVTPALPYALAFAAGAMMFVVAEELIPESRRHGHVHLATMGVLVGFALMMVLDVAFG